MTFPVLIADIGATNARFTLAPVVGDEAAIGPTIRLATADHSSAEAMLDAALLALGGVAPAASCLAVAGPVIAGEARLTNAGHRFNTAALTTHLGCPVLLVNDFVALARSLPHLEHLRQLGGGPGESEALRAVLGPGSGLGMGMLLPQGKRWLVITSEGGHADLVPGTPLEVELLGLLQAAHGHVFWETVLCGPGLVRLYRAVCQIWGTEARDDATPAWVLSAGMDASDLVCHQTLELFAGLLGSAAGNLALMTAARGGVYLGGGIVPRCVDYLLSSPLRRRFEERGEYHGYVRDIPLWLILDAEPALVGALECLREHLLREG